MHNYQVGGSLSPDHPYYVRRQADADLYQALSNGQFCYVFNARQMGKSSLMVQVFHQLQQDGVCCGAIDLSRIGSENLTPEQWYKGFAVELWQAFDLFGTVNLKQWWDERKDLSPVQRLGQFIEEILLLTPKSKAHTQPKLVVFLDEVDSIYSLNFSLNDFFGLIRVCYNRRSLQPEYQRLTFALLGVATPADLIADRQRTPFNIGRAINLGEFHQTDAQPLAQGLVGSVHDPSRALQEILMWTSGQPFLMQKLCQLLVEHPISTQSLTDCEHIHQLVENSIIKTWEFQDEPEHLRTIRDRLLNHPQLTGRILDIYQQILTHEAVEFDGSREQIQLLLSGLVIKQQGQLVVKNPIYQAVFNLNWVCHHLAQLRPYAESLNAWMISGKGDESYLLRGQTLQDAFTWALGKSLSSEDYQFLGASQELAKREVQTALEAVEQASQMLATARQRAKREVQKRRISWRSLPRIMLSITVPILLLRGLGLLQGVELDLFDQFVRWRPLEPPDRRIMIVAIDEQDITQVGYPMPDRVLAQAIKNIQAQKPRVIGLDIYRDLPVEPGHTDLVQVFQSTSNLFGIEKVVGSRVAPPPILSQKQQVGFADQVEDADGKVRRALLSVETENTSQYSLAVKLALSYLADEGLALQQLDEAGRQFKLGKAIFQRFESQDGGYVNAQAGKSYQIMLNFRGSEANFLTVSLRQVLNRQISAQQFSDRIVLIGYSAESVGDRFRTPDNGSWFNPMLPINGVTLHANIVSQIISAALDGRPLIRVWSKPLEWLWVLFWAGVGALISRWLRSPLKLAIGILCTTGGLIGSSYLAFLSGWWIPVVPPLLGLWGSAIALVIVTTKQRDRLQFQRTLNLLLAAQQDYPTAARIAIEYLKQSEPQEHQAAIERQLK
ncbi:CHASE2 domain-containing protein [Desmonostoc muscorum LEGE 12446]|uniref:CHASE2 domain-containing protein n=1 Tax=Desmonostoc muscorum LEGE 12446 TaxID=1828758 RepID=A0A8J7CWA5_DESMC|nr:CHASE2 domain-containing protein [Desmonostoc muscorum]MCF2149781.1 CHASE2 domain-containing protein [Desmonostoc muscorum LEGE 12446]